MKFKIAILTLLVVGLSAGLTGIAFGAVGLTRTADVDFPGSPGATNVVLGAVTATESNVGPDTIISISVVNTGNTGVDAELTKLSLYNDVNGNDAFDFNDTLVAGATTSTVAGYTNAGGGVTLTPTSPITIAQAEAQKYLDSC